MAAVNTGFELVATLYDGCKFRAVVQENLRLSSLVNQYLEDTSPWTAAKTDMQATKYRSLYTAIQAISGLKVLWAPILPFTSQQLHEMLRKAAVSLASRWWKSTPKAAKPTWG